MKLSAALIGLRPFLIGVVAPIGAYFGLRALGVADLTALLDGGGVAALDALISTAIARRLQPLPVFVCGMFALTGGLAWATHDARVFLLKASIASAAIGAYLLALCANETLLNRALAPLLARGSEDRAARWKRAWETDSGLRRVMRVSCLLAGFALFAEAAARAAIVLHFTIGQSLFLAHAPAVLLVVALGLMLRFFVTPAVARAMADRREVVQD